MLTVITAAPAAVMASAKFSMDAHIPRAPAKRTASRHSRPLCATTVAQLCAEFRKLYRRFCIIDAALSATVPNQYMMLRKLPICLLLGLTALTAGPVLGLDSRAYIEKSVTLIESGEYSLARTYLAPALIDYRLSASERSRAFYLRGYSYLADDLPVAASKDYNRALEFNSENPAALAALGHLHFRGLGMPQDEVVAFGLYSQAAELDHRGAQIHLGFSYLEGRGVEQNVVLARQWLEGPAAAENPAAMNFLARSYRVEFADPAEPELARQWYERAFAAGAADSLVSLAYMHQKGEFGEIDHVAALRVFTEAASAGSSAALVSLGHLYLAGDGVTADAARALALFEQAAEQGNPASYLSIGHLYETGTGVAQNLATAQAWYEQGANAGVMSAQLRLVYLLLNQGESTAALPWLAQAAEAENPIAHNDYAWLLATNPDDTIRDGALALSYAQRAVAKVQTPAYLDTLAAAYAELGQFAEAVATQEQAIALVDDAQSELAAELQGHLLAYRDGKPWRE